MKTVKITLFQATVTADLLNEYREELLQRKNIRKAEVIKNNLDLLQDAIDKMQKKKTLPDMESPELFK